MMMMMIMNPCPFPIPFLVLDHQGLMWWWWWWYLESWKKKIVELQELMPKLMMELELKLKMKMKMKMKQVPSFCSCMVCWDCELA